MLMVFLTDVSSPRVYGFDNRTREAFSAGLYKMCIEPYPVSTSPPCHPPLRCLALSSRLHSWQPSLSPPPLSAQALLPHVYAATLLLMTTNGRLISFTVLSPIRPVSFPDDISWDARVPSITGPVLLLPTTRLPSILPRRPFYLPASLQHCPTSFFPLLFLRSPVWRPRYAAWWLQCRFRRIYY